MSIKIDKRTGITFSLNRPLTTRQVLIAKLLAKSYSSYLPAYLATFQGQGNNNVANIVKQYLKVPSSSYTTDFLSQKQKGQILREYMAKIDPFNETRALKPTKQIDIGDCVGIEVECYSPLSIATMKQLIADKDIKLKNIKCGSDGSVKAPQGNYTYEFRLITDVNTFDSLKNLCSFLTLIKAKVNASCGLHIHLDMRERKELPAGIVQRLKDALPLLKAMVPQGRVNDFYCGHDISSNAQSNARYSKINTTAFSKHGTIEIRLHSGTTDFTKISNWVKVCHSIAFSKCHHFSSDKASQYAEKLNWSKELLEYVTARIEKFKNQSEVEIKNTYRRPDDRYSANEEFERVA